MSKAWMANALVFTGMAALVAAAAVLHISAGLAVLGVLLVITGIGVIRDAGKRPE